MKSSYNKAKFNFNNRKRKKVIEVEEVKVEESNFLSNIFPIIIIFAILAIFGCFYFLFLNYQKVVIVDMNGYFLSNNDTLLMGSKKNSKQNNTLEVNSVKENDTIYKNKLNYYFANERKNSVSINYPLFSNDGLSIINYNDNVNLIDSTFEKSEGYSGLMLSYGGAYDTYDYKSIDKNDYFLLIYPDNISINLFDLKITTTANEYIIPVNSIVYFEKDKLSYYERKDKSFVYKEINDVDYNSKLELYYEAAEKSFKYNYEEFLNKTNTAYIPKKHKDEEVIEPDKPQEETKPNDKDKNNNKDNVNNNDNSDNEPGKIIWEKPSVNISNVSPSVYSVSANLEIKDPAGVIVKAPTFTIYRNNKVYMKRAYYASGNISINGFVPSSTFTIVGQYTYLSEDLKYNIISTFYKNTISTGPLSDLKAIDLSLKNGDIYSRKIEIKDVKVVSDLQDEAIKGISRAAIDINGKNYYLTNNQINTIINGKETNVSTSESLSSSTEINYNIKFFDRENNSIITTGSSGKTRTSKMMPSVNLRVIKSEVDEVTIGANIKNEDNVELNDFIYVVTSSDGRVLKEDYVNSSFAITDLDPDQLFNIKVYASLDIDDGKGLIKDIELSSMDFISKPISSLGYINLNMEQVNVTSDSFELKYSINSNKTDKKLIRLLNELRFEIYDENDEELIKSITINGEDINSIKDEKELNLLFQELSSNTKYKLHVKTILKQGSSSYEIDTTQSLNDFTTNKKSAYVSMTNSFTTETMIDFDVKIVDEDNAILTDYVRLELRDKNNKIKDSRRIKVNSDKVERVTYNNLNTNEFYNIYFYADEYNETRKNSTYKSKYLFKQVSIYTESGISGKVELRSSLRVANGVNLADVKSEVKWVEITDYYTVPKTVDEDGNLHIYSKNGGGNYAYDLSDYHGEFVTVSFSIKTVNNSNNYSVYFTNHLSGTTNGNYSKKLDGINSESFKKFTFTYRVGNYSKLNTSLNSYKYKIYEPMTSKWYGKNYSDFASFYINGGNSILSEFIIKDFEVHKSYDKEEYTDPNYPVYKFEQGSYSAKNKYSSDFYIRLSDKILLKKGYKYTFLFDNDNTYKMHVYLSDSNDKYQTGFGWYNSEITYEATEDKYARIWFQYRDGNGLIKPGDIKNFRIIAYKANNVVPKTEFTYDLVTKIKVNLTDKRDEIPDNDYFIKLINNGVEEKSYRYTDLEESNIVEDLIKEIELNEKKNYTIELGIKIRDRYYALNSFELSTEDEVLGISNTNEWTFIEPYGRYIILNDLDFQDYTEQRLGWGNRLFHGTIDFQGYTAHLAIARTNGTVNPNYVKIYRIEEDATIKNAVFDIDVNNNELSTSVYGFVQYNYGTIENVMLNIKDTHNKDMPQYFYGLLTYYNGIHGRIRNFSIKIDGKFYMYHQSSILTRENYGLIENGYIYGDNIVILPKITSVSNNREVGILFRYGGVKSKVRNVFSLISYEFEDDDSYAGQFAGYYTAGKIENSYIYGDTNPLISTRGPFATTSNGTTQFVNAHYISKNIYNQGGVEQIKSSVVSLLDKTFQKNILGDNFVVDDMLTLGYYPQVKFTSNKMPEQEYIPLPEINTDEYANIISMDAINKQNSSATINVLVDNPMGEEISEIVITGLDTNIVDQSYKEGKSNVTLEVSNPTTFVSKYQVRSISSRSASGYTSTRKYATGEKYLYIDFYKEIYTIADLLKINKALNQNYILMNDLDFTGYTEFYLNNFSGKFNGNNHVMKNISMTKDNKNGLFNQMNGVLENVRFENVYISRSSAYYGIVGYSNSNGSYNNVHIKDITIEIPETVVRENMHIGSLVGYPNGSSISYSSATNVKITSNSPVAGITVGGLVGYANQLMLDNSFTQNVDISVTKAISTNGVGGLVGREASWDASAITNCYSTGKVFSNLANTGGIVGFTNSYVNNSYSSVDVTSDMSFIAGITGSSRVTLSNIENNLYLGNIYTASTDSNIHRISGNYTSNKNNYAMKESLINGASSNEENGETILNYKDYLKEETYENILGKNEFDFSKSKDGILPKLFDATGENLLPYQNDNHLFVNMFNVDRIVIDKHAEDADILLNLDNPNHFEIKSIKVENAQTEITRNVLDGDKTILYFKLTPNKAYDTYRLSKLVYVDGNGEEHSLDRNIRIDATFYKHLKNFDDWQNVSKFEAENYLLEADIDFTGKTNINTGVMFNRLETADDNVKYTLKNIDLKYTKNANYISLIQKVSTSFKNIGFSGITITNTSTGNNNYNNIVMYSYGELSNLSFEDIEINAKYKNYVGVIGKNYANKIHDITLDNIRITARQYVGGFIANVDANANDLFENINASNIHINTTSTSAGGVFGHFNNAIDYGDKPIYNHINIRDSEIISTSYYVGGVSGYGDCNYCMVDNVHVKGKYYVGGAVGYQRGQHQRYKTVKNSNIEGTDYYIGGIYGYSYLTYNDQLIDSTVTGLNSSTYGVGGISGYKSNWSYTYRSGVTGSTIVNAGDRTGGLIGYHHFTGGTGYIYGCYVNNSTIVGATKVGGLIGTATKASYFQFDKVSNSTIRATDKYAGGAVGYFDNNNEYGAHSEGYLNQVNVENCNIESSTYAGGIFGGSAEDPYYANRVRRIYFSGNVNATDNVTYGIASGDSHNFGLINQPRIYFYENSMVNGNIIKDSVSTTKVSDNDLLNKISFYPGYVTNGVPTYNESDVRAEYSDLIKLDGGKTYQLDVDYKTYSNTYTMYLYNEQQVYVSAINSGSVEAYIEKIVNPSYNNKFRFRVYKDCYIRINILRKDHVNSISLKEVNLIGTSLDEARLLNVGHLREKLTWVYSIGNTSAINSSKLDYSTSYWNFTPINNKIPKITVNDLSGNNHSATGKVSSISKNGVMFDGTGEETSSLKVNNYKLPTTGHITISAKVRGDVAWPYQSIFSSTTGSQGMGLYLQYFRIYVLINGSYYDTQYYVPMNEEVDITAIYDANANKNNYIYVYVNGKKVFQRTVTKLVVPNNALTYVGYDKKYAPSHYTYRFVGLIKNVQVYDRVLSEDEIKNNISSSGVTNTTGLSLYYDFTKNTPLYEAYYPKVKYGNSDGLDYDEEGNIKVMEKQELIPLPTGDEINTMSLFSTRRNSSRNLYLNSIITNNYSVYSSGINTINLEFKDIPNDLSFTYEYKGKKYTSKVNKKVYSLVYNYDEEAKIILKNTYETKEIKINQSEISKKLKYINNKYYYISNGVLYENNNELLEEAKHIYNNLVLLSNNKLYNLDTKNIQNIYNNEGILSDSIPLEINEFEGKTIKTYYYYTLVGNEEVDYQMYIKNNELFLFDNSETLNNNIVYGKYNLEDYQIILTNNNSLKSLKSAINYPLSFANANIVEINFDKSRDDNIIMVRYKSGDVLAFNYVSGLETFSLSNEMKLNVFEYITSSVSSSTLSLKSTNIEYKLSKKLIESINSSNDNNINDLIDNLTTFNNNTSNKLKTKYVNVYNSTTGKYDVFNVNELITIDKKENIKDENKIDKNKLVIKQKDITPISDKLKLNDTLYNKFFSNISKNDVEDNKSIIYIIILSVVVLNLFALSYVYSKKEKNNA